MELYFLALEYVAFYIGEPLDAFMLISNSFRRLIKTVKWEKLSKILNKNCRAVLIT
jgi:hypothetical protein